MVHILSKLYIDLHQDLTTWIPLDIWYKYPNKKLPQYHNITLNCPRCGIWARIQNLERNSLDSYKALNRHCVDHGDGRIADIIERELKIKLDLDSKDLRPLLHWEAKVILRKSKCE